MPFPFLKERHTWHTPIDRLADAGQIVPEEIDGGARTYRLLGGAS